MKSYWALLIVAVGCAEPTTTSTPNSYDGRQLTAELTRELPGSETISATVSQVTLFDSEGGKLDSADAFEPQGSADEVVELRVAEGGLRTPLVVITTTVGGHRESATYSSLYIVSGRHLRNVFSGVTEEVEDESDREGALLILPGMLVYRSPSAERPSILSFDSKTRRYELTP